MGSVFDMKDIYPRSGTKANRKSAQGAEQEVDAGIFLVYGPIITLIKETCYIYHFRLPWLNRRRYLGPQGSYVQGLASAAGPPDPATIVFHASSAGFGPHIGTITSNMLN